MIGIVNYRAGNIASLSYALDGLGIPYQLSNKAEELSQCEKLILPGVGHAEFAMQQLADLNLIEFIREFPKPFLGICLGMQLLFEQSEESGDLPLLGVVPGKLKKFDVNLGPMTHMGWNTVNGEDDLYFVHSYYAPVVPETIGTTEYQTPFTSIVKKDHYLGYQFHPEKSSKVGQKYLQQFIEG